MKLIKYGISSIIFSLCVILLVVNFGEETFAHSPSNMDLEFDIENKTLDIIITHIVANPDNHYVNNIEIRKNDILYSTQQYTSQPSSSTFTYSLEVNATKTDKLIVIASCNQGGSMTKTLITNGQNANNGDGRGIPGFEIIPLILSIAGLLFIAQRKRNY